MNNLTRIGNPPWSKEEIIEAITRFEELYQSRPIKDNLFGMKAPSMFAAWFMAKRLSPNIIIESGIWKGQSTWLFEKACPKAQLMCIDVNLSMREYISKGAIYFNRDFSDLDWSGIPKASTLIFFDDHQNAYSRLQQCKWFGFQDIIFDDNYPISHGDCYSLKKAFAGVGFEEAFSADLLNSSSTLARGIRKLLWTLRIIRPFTPQYTRVRIEPNTYDAAALMTNLEVYYEFPPVFMRERTQWGDGWDQKDYPTQEPLLGQDLRDCYPSLWEEAMGYSWPCYVRLKE